MPSTSQDELPQNTASSESNHRQPSSTAHPLRRREAAPIRSSDVGSSHGSRSTLTSSQMRSGPFRKFSPMSDGADRSHQSHGSGGGQSRIQKKGSHSSSSSRSALLPSSRLPGASVEELPSTSSSSSLIKSSLRPDAPEFVPGSLLATSSPISRPSNYAEALTTGMLQQPVSADNSNSSAATVAGGDMTLCPYYMVGQCWYGDQCTYAHGLFCDLCQQPVLHPGDEEQNKVHRKECLEEHEKNMEESFELAHSREKVCGICMELVLDKKNGQAARRFGILQSCKHCFCLDCIRKWRASRTFENKIVRACPECRTVSDFVTPSSVWVEDETKKSKLIGEYKEALMEKNCKYFRKGEAECPFGNQCFYKHAKPDGTIVKGDSPKTVHKRMNPRRRFHGSRDSPLAREILQEYYLWQFLEDRDESAGSGSEWNLDDSFASGERAASWIMEMALDDELLSLTSDSEESDIFDHLHMLSF